MNEPTEEIGTHTHRGAGGARVTVDVRAALGLSPRSVALSFSSSAASSLMSRSFIPDTSAGREGQRSSGSVFLSSHKERHVETIHGELEPDLLAQLLHFFFFWWGSL